MNTTEKTVIGIYVIAIIINIYYKNYFIIFINVLFVLPLIIKCIYNHLCFLYKSYQYKKLTQKICQKINFKHLKQIENKISDECCICLDEFGEDENIILLPCECFQIYHEKCIKPWLHKNLSCPSCRSEILNNE
jgi:hypothetical protein